MIKYSTKRFGSCDSVFCRLIPIVRGNNNEVYDIVSYMESQNYIKYLKYKMPRRFGDSLFRDFVVGFNNANKTYEFISTATKEQVSKKLSNEDAYFGENVCRIIQFTKK